MQKITFLALALCIVFVSTASAVEIKTADIPRPETSDNSAQIQKFLAATGLLYVQDAGGNMQMDCTTTAFEKKPKKDGGFTYRFVSASHCVASDDETRKEVKVQKSNFFITLDEDNEKKFLTARVLAAGYQTNGDDFAVLEVETTSDIPIMPFAANPPKAGERVINVASPLGLGKQVFFGQVSMARLARAVQARDISWKDAVLLQISIGGGSSGSAVLSIDQEGIVAFIVGYISEGQSPNVVAISADKFNAFWTAASQGKYKWFKAEE